MPNRFAARVLHDRTRTLAARGARTEIELLPPHLLCRLGTRFVALPAEIVAQVRPFDCQPLPLIRPGAAGIVLGVALIGRMIVSVIALDRLLPVGDGHAAVPSGGSMIKLRGGEKPVALRVDEVIGVLALQPAAEPGHARVPDAVWNVGSGTALPMLAALIPPTTLAAAIAALDDGRTSSGA